jgi:RNA polymerase sigma-70 factor (ECF subfamily)
MTFKEVYEQYRAKIYRLCMGFVNDRELAEDITQDSFMIAWEQFSNFRNESAISTWIFRIATNNCLRQIERRKKIFHSTLSGKAETRHTDDDTDIEVKVQLLYKFISELPEIDRIIISLELENINQSEIAKIAGLSESNIRVKIYRIKEKLIIKFKNHEQRENIKSVME